METDPLQVLVRPHNEVQKMNEDRIKHPRYGRVHPLTSYLGKYCIQHSGIVVRKGFDTFEKAEKWATYNYKGKENWRVVKIFERDLKFFSDEGRNLKKIIFDLLDTYGESLTTEQITVEYGDIPNRITVANYKVDWRKSHSNK